MNKPEFVGEGTYGCVHKPPMKCKNKQQSTDNSIATKLMLDKDAKDEMTEFKLIESADKKELFHLGKPKICKADTNNENRTATMSCPSRRFSPNNMEAYSLLLIKYGGLDLEKYGKRIKEFSLNVANRRNVEHFWMDISRIMYGLYTLGTKGKVHHDLKQQNIVYNPDTGRANLIDFGLMTTKYKIIAASIKSTYGFSTLHWSFPTECELLNKNLYLSVTKDLKSKQKYFTHVLSHVQKNHIYFFTSISKYNGNTAEYKNELKQHLNEYYQMLLSLEPNKYNDFLQKCVNTIDIYGTCIALLYVLHRSRRFLETECYNDMNSLFLKGVHQNVFLRSTPDELMTNYESLLLKHGLLEKYNMKFEKHLLIEGNPIEVDVANKIESVVKGDMHMTPKEQTEFIKSVIIKCPDGKEYKPSTKRCVKECKPGYIRNAKFQCRKQSKRTTAKKSKSAKKCPPGKELNKKTNRCNKTCKVGYIRDDSFKCRKEK